LREEGVALSPDIANSPAIRAGRMLQAVLAAPSPEAFVKLGEDYVAVAEAQPSAALDLAVGLAVLGLAGPALGIFETALENIDAWRLAAPDAQRPHIGYETALLFIQATAALRYDPGFVRLCARLGLVRYWAESGLWPDCAAETPYDFKAACAAFI
jgi:adenylate cyclase